MNVSVNTKVMTSKISFHIRGMTAWGGGGEFFEIFFEM